MNGKRGLPPIFMARIALLSSVVFGIQLCGCSENTSLGTETETVHIVAYDKGNFKMSGDRALLSNDRSLQIRSNWFAEIIGWPRVWLPGEITERDYWRLRGSSAELTKLKGIEAKLDSRNGLVCIEGKCYPLMAICPPFTELKAGKKCQSFPKK